MTAASGAKEKRYERNMIIEANVRFPRVLRDI